MKFLLGGLRRSGQHMVHHWIASHIPGIVYHMNGVSVVNEKTYKRKNGNFWYEDGEYLGNKYVHTMNPPKYDSLFLSVEDRSIDKINLVAEKLGIDQEPWIIVRSFYNLVASRLRKLEDTGESSARYNMFRVRDDVPVIWKEHIQSNKVILFDLLLGSKKYRKEIHKRMNLPGKVKPLPAFVSDNGGGSSFTGMKEVPKGEDLIRRFESIDIPKELLKDKEVRRLNIKHFGYAMNKKGEII